MIFLDRDGVINEKIEGSYVLAWDTFRYVPGIREALRQLSTLGHPIIIVSNQAGVGKGLMDRDTLIAITLRFVEELLAEGIRIDAAYYCPHTTETRCPCRKPQPGLLTQAAGDWDVDLARSVFIGDSATDVEAAAAAGCHSILFSANSLENKCGQTRAILAANTSEIFSAVLGLLG